MFWCDVSPHCALLQFCPYKPFWLCLQMRGMIFGCDAVVSVWFLFSPHFFSCRLPVNEMNHNKWYYVENIYWIWIISDLVKSWRAIMSTTCESNSLYMKNSNLFVFAVTRNKTEIRGSHAVEVRIPPLSWRWRYFNCRNFLIFLHNCWWICRSLIAEKFQTVNDVITFMWYFIFETVFAILWNYNNQNNPGLDWVDNTSEHCIPKYSEIYYQQENGCIVRVK